MRTVMRPVKHVIRSHPGTAPTVAARCLKIDCGWAARDGLTLAECDLACLGHSGRTGHRSFQRTFTDMAVVERVSDRGTAPS